MDTQMAEAPPDILLTYPMILGHLDRISGVRIISVNYWMMSRIAEKDLIK